MSVSSTKKNLILTEVVNLGVGRLGILSIDRVLFVRVEFDFTFDFTKKRENLHRDRTPTRGRRRTDNKSPIIDQQTVSTSTRFGFLAQKLDP